MNDLHKIDSFKDFDSYMMSNDTIYCYLSREAEAIKSSETQRLQYLLIGMTTKCTEMENRLLKSRMKEHISIESNSDK